MQIASANWETVSLAIVKRVAKSVCGALNARVDMTIYLGVNADGRVTGLEVEGQEMVSSALRNVY